MRSLRHELVKIFGGTYYTKKNSVAIDCESYTGRFPLWIGYKIHRIKFRSVMLWYDVQILYYKVIIYIQNKFNNEK